MSNRDERTDQVERLLERAKQGDEPALNELLQRHREALRSTAHELLGPKVRVRADGSDIVQKVLIEIAQDFVNFRGQSSAEFWQWCRRILERDIQEILQREKYAARRSIDREVEGSAEVRQAAGRQTSPSRRAMRSEERQLIREAMEQLSEEWREVMRLKHLEHVTLADIAATLGKSESAVSRLLLHGMRELKLILKQRGITDL